MNRRTVLRLGAATALGTLATEFGGSAVAQQKLVLKAAGRASDRLPHR